MSRLRQLPNEYGRCRRPAAFPTNGLGLWYRQAPDAASI